MSQSPSPFKFLDSYQQADADVFFGREKETNDLYSALSGVKHLLVYGPSGSGKTSLVECGLRNQFSDADWFAITIRRGTDIIASVYTHINEALHEKIETDPISKMPLNPEIEFGHAVEKLFSERYQPVYLLLDQFEELLISGDKDEKEKFFTLLNKLIQIKVPCRIMLIMREEFIGHLSEFEALCPSIFQHRFRVEKMGRKNVEEVIYHILEAPRYQVYFNVEESQKLAESILSKLPDKRKEIELAHVQVFLGELWDRAQAVKQNSDLPVMSSSLIHDDDNLEGILESFLKKQISELEVSYGERVPLELLAAMISERFTKLQLSQTTLQKDLEQNKVISKKPIADLLKELEHRRIIRIIKVGDETQYEISHDVLALVVGQNLTNEMKLREKAGEIYNLYMERKGLFSQDDIDYLRPFQQSLSYPSDLQTRIDESIGSIKKKRDEELVKTRKQLRIVYSLLGGTLLALMAAGYFWFNANKQTRIARANYFISEAKTAMASSDPTLALRLVEQAMLINNNSSIEQYALKIYAENSFYKIIKENNKGINAIAFSPDGKTILIGLKDSTARLCDLNGKLIQKFTGHFGEVWSVAFSRTGKTILTGSNDETARLWDLHGILIRKFTGNSGKIYSVAFSPDGKKILTGSNDKKARLWDLNGNLIQVFSGHSGGVWSVAFSPYGDSILTGSADKTARLWDLKGTTLMEFKGHSGEVGAVVFSPDGKTIRTGSIDKTVRLWDFNGKTIHELKGHIDEILSIAFSPDGNKILTGSSDKTARLWDMKGNVVNELKGHSDNITSVAFSPDGKSILTGSKDKTARLWDLHGCTLQEFKSSSYPITCVAFSSDGKKILTSSKDSTARLWDLKGSIIKYFKCHHGNIASITFSANGNIILTGSEDGTICVFDFKRDSLTRTFRANYTSVTAIAFSPDGNRILTGSVDKKARLWDLQGNLLHEFIGHSGRITCVAFSPDGTKILTGSWDSTARIWDLNGNTIQKFKGHTDQVWSVAFSPDGKKILTGSWDYTARMWDLNGHTIQEFKGHTRWVTSSNFSPDGKNILTGSNDQTTRLWDLKGNTLMVFTTHSGFVTSVAFSPNGKTILSGSQDGTARLWEIPMPLEDFLRSDKVEPLSPQQKKQYGIE